MLFRNSPSIFIQDIIQNNSVEAMNLKECKSIYISRLQGSFSSNQGFNKSLEVWLRWHRAPDDKFYPDNLSSIDYNQKHLWLRLIRGEYGFDIEDFKDNL